ncbi:MAG: hypothetical protein FD189_338 [Elusimicrobia bacterium]|nr:MAG: hypothetical protein FD154_418 [Elusimicrobiota bacterium]KAF0157817.1 MAG: hypothetical protein FD189_338 [Elusimicrobiota bacterium]
MAGKGPADKKGWTGLKRAGQVLIPSLFVIPTLFLFVYLLFETAKISREKIRQQFAVDSAAFIQMGDYTNFFNRTAYVNGAFPYRIFKEAFECPSKGPGIDHVYKYTNKEEYECLYDMMYDNGAIPKYDGDEPRRVDPKPLDSEPEWSIGYKDTLRPGINSLQPGDTLDERLILITHPQGQYIYIFWNEASGFVYKFYAQVYTLLGSVQESQYTVFKRLTERFNFFRKSYYLNASPAECVENPAACGEQGLTEGHNNFASKRISKSHGNFAMHFIQKIKFFCKRPYTHPILGQQYQMVETPDIDMPSPGLFQIASVKKDILRDLGRGVEIFQGWNSGNNYFNVDFDGGCGGRCSQVVCRETGRPCVHARVTTQCPASDNNCVWPNPTPKYQTRLYP